MPRDLAAEVERMLGSAAFQFFSDAKGDRVLDTDFYAFLGCTVRTPANEFVGRISVCEEAVRAAKRTRHPSAEVATALAKAWSFLDRKFKDVIERRKARR
jgi:hypothetical protein